jgi:hypothetical protein
MDWETQDNSTNEEKQDFNVKEVSAKDNLQPPQNSDLLSKPVSQQIPSRGARIKERS